LPDHICAFGVHRIDTTTIVPTFHGFTVQLTFAVSVHDVQRSSIAAPLPRCGAAVSISSSSGALPGLNGDACVAVIVVMCPNREKHSSPGT
jgi:hypothetical protein